MPGPVLLCFYLVHIYFHTLHTLVILWLYFGFSGFHGDYGEYPFLRHRVFSLQHTSQCTKSPNP